MRRSYGPANIQNPLLQCLLQWLGLHSTSSLSICNAGQVSRGGRLNAVCQRQAAPFTSNTPQCHYTS